MKCRPLAGWLAGSQHQPIQLENGQRGVKLCIRLPFRQMNRGHVITVMCLGLHPPPPPPLLSRGIIPISWKHLWARVLLTLAAEGKECNVHRTFIGKVGGGGVMGEGSGGSIKGQGFLGALSDWGLREGRGASQITED